MNRSVLHTLAAVALMAITAGAQQSIPALESGEAKHDVQPIISEVTVSASTVTDVHLQPLFTTTIRLPDSVSSVAVGALRCRCGCSVPRWPGVGAECHHRRLPSDGVGDHTSCRVLHPERSAGRLRTCKRHWSSERSSVSLLRWQCQLPLLRLCWPACRSVTRVG